MKTAILLPTLNEVEAIGEMIKRVRVINPEFDIYVVDSGSTDGTVDIAKNENARIISLSERGKGLAIKKAFLEVDCDQLVLLDSDSSYMPEEIPVLLKALEVCDVVVGSRFAGKIEEGSMKGLNRFGNKMLTLLGDVLYGRNKTDLCSGFWAFKRESYKKMTIDAKHFSLEANLFVECSKHKLRLCEVPITYGKRQGQTKLSPLHGFEIGGYLLRRRVG